jgi:hypothetical protein
MMAKGGQAGIMRTTVTLEVIMSWVSFLDFSLDKVDPAVV